MNCDESAYSAAVLLLGAKAVIDVLDHHLLEVGGDRRSAQRAELLAVDEHRRGRRFAGAGQRDADVGVLGFAGTVDDAAHHRDVERLDAGILASSSSASRRG